VTLQMRFGRTNIPKTRIVAVYVVSLPFLDSNLFLVLCVNLGLLAGEGLFPVPPMATPMSKSVKVV